MLNKLKTALLITLGFMPMALAAPAVVYADAASGIQSGVDQAANQAGGQGTPSDQLATTIKNILNIMSGVAGVAAVAILIVAGIRFAASGGSETAVKSAKSSIVYAIIGIVLVALAQVIVHFVIVNISSS